MYRRVESKYEEQKVAYKNLKNAMGIASEEDVALEVSTFQMRNSDTPREGEQASK